MRRIDGCPSAADASCGSLRTGTGAAPHLLADDAGAVLVEVALSFPILIILLLGILSYGSWLMAAHTVQQAANEAARAALAGISSSERQLLADESLRHSIDSATFIDPALVSLSASQSGAFYSVAVSYDAARSRIFAISPVPLPATIIRRTAVVKLGGA